MLVNTRQIYILSKTGSNEQTGYRLTGIALAGREIRSNLGQSSIEIKVMKHEHFDSVTSNFHHKGDIKPKCFFSISFIISTLSKVSHLSGGGVLRV